MKRPLVGFLVGLFLWQASAFQAPGTHPVTGRKIAGVMGMGGADWLVRPERETEEQPEKALDALNLKPGMVVADIRAGVGYMSLRIAKRVGPAGRVYAKDLQPEMLEPPSPSARQAANA